MDRRTTPANRRGGIYIVVLATVMIVALLGTAGVLAQTSQRQRARGAQDAPKAAAMARAGLDIALERIAADADWRTNIGGGTWYDRAAPTGDPDDGVFSLTVSAPGGGAFDSADNKPYKLTAIGSCGTASRVISLTYDTTPGVAPADCLEVTVLCEKELEAHTGSTVLGTGVMASNKSASASAAQVHPDVEAVGTVTGALFHATTTDGVAARTVPDENTLLSAYEARGAIAIDRDHLDKQGADYHLSGVVLAPGHNPFGAGEAHPEGIYIIDMGNKKLYIEDARIHGTLILIQPKNGSEVRGSVNITPAVEGYPSLIVTQKNMEIITTLTPLDESALGVNFNPVGSLVEGGEDSDTLDTYPSVIEGIVYVNGEIKFKAGSQSVIRGHLISDKKVKFEAGSIAQFQDWDEAVNSPPPGFQVSAPSELVMGPIVRELD